MYVCTCTIWEEEAQRAESITDWPLWVDGSLCQDAVYRALSMLVQIWLLSASDCLDIIILSRVLYHVGKPI
jgi:hypothetical protein